MYPDGTVNRKGDHFWNATDACCDMDRSAVDDSGYIKALIDEIGSRYRVDPKRVFLVGHSNGGYMSYRMACDHADRIAALVSIAGATWQDSARCKPQAPVSVLQVHGTADAEVPYEGGPGFPGARETVARWAALDGCSPEIDRSSPPLDIDDVLPGAETTISHGASPHRRAPHDPRAPGRGGR